MAKTQTETKKNAADAPKEAENNGSLAVISSEQPRGTWQNFQAELHDREREIASLLPSHISKEKFINTAIAAVKQNPAILQATQRSLFAAIIKSAQDGILPDGREGFINTYNTKVTEHGKPERWELVAQWSPMAYGLRKRARELEGILIDAQVVYKNDLFKRVQGDNPAIIHEPVAPGEDAGPMIATYAIFKKEDGTILGREVMDAAQVAMVRAQSKAQNSLMWTKFETEGWRKSVIRRGMKSIPVSEKLESIIGRDDDSFHFSNEPQLDDGTVRPPIPRHSEFARGIERHSKVLQEWTTKGNYANTEAALDDVRKGAMAALPEELKAAFNEFLDERQMHILRSNAQKEIRQDPPPEDGQQAKAAEGDGTAEATETASAEADAAGKAVLDAILRTGIEGLPNVHRQGALADLREQVEQELPPDSQHLKAWIKACEKRQNELLAAQREKAKK